MFISIARKMTAYRRGSYTFYFCVLRMMGTNLCSLQHSSELEPQALKLPLGISLARSLVAIIKSGGAAGASIDDMQ